MQTKCKKCNNTIEYKQRDTPVFCRLCAMDRCAACSVVLCNKNIVGLHRNYNKYKGNICIDCRKQAKRFAIAFQHSLLLKRKEEAL